MKIKHGTNRMEKKKDILSDVIQSARWIARESVMDSRRKSAPRESVLSAAVQFQENIVKKPTVW